MYVIVPDFVAEAINTALDRELANFPEASVSRGHLFDQLLEWYNEHGELPDFRIVKNEKEEA